MLKSGWGNLKGRCVGVKECLTVRVTWSDIVPREVCQNACGEAVKAEKMSNELL